MDPRAFPSRVFADFPSASLGSSLSASRGPLCRGASCSFSYVASLLHPANRSNIGAVGALGYPMMNSRPGHVEFHKIVNHQGEQEKRRSSERQMSAHSQLICNYLVSRASWGGIKLNDRVQGYECQTQSSNRRAQAAVHKNTEGVLVCAWLLTPGPVRCPGSSGLRLCRRTRWAACRPDP